MQITAQMVKELRGRTGSAMMDCKRALEECQGDMDAAADMMRKSGQAKADKKAARIAAHGAIAVASAADNKNAAIVEVNCETDFVAKGDEFLAYVQSVADLALASHATDVEAFKQVLMNDGRTVEQARLAIVAKIGENIQLRRIEQLKADTIGVYRHGRRIGVVVGLAGGDIELAKDVAMHVAASRPVCVSEADAPQDVLAKERELFTAQAAESGKPPEIVEKMVDGKIKKYLAEITLLGQPFVKDPETTVGKLLSAKGAKCTGFMRFEAGEGIEKRKEDFAAEVAAAGG